MRKKCLQHLLHKGSPGVQLIIAIREPLIYKALLDFCSNLNYHKLLGRSVSIKGQYLLIMVIMPKSHFLTYRL